MIEIADQKKNVETLLTLVANNPDLEIVPMVDHEVIAECYGWWKGFWGTARLDEYWDSAEAERIYFRSETEDTLIDEACDKIIDGDQTMDADAAYEKAKEQVQAYDWIKCIAVRITT